MNRTSVLIVEDERIVAKDIQQTLLGMGYDAFAIASSGDEAIAFASERCPDVVLMDIRIKGRRDGIETAEVLKSKFSLPIVYLTAHADAATIARAKKTEPHGYLLKPVKAAELRSVIEVSVFKHAMEKRLRERERWFSTTLHSIADAVVAVDLAGKVCFMNDAAEMLTGVKVEAAMGRPAGEVLRLNPSTENAGETPLDMVLRVKHPVELSESLLLNAVTGTERLISDITAPVTDDGQTLGAVMVFRDVTEQKKLQKQLELADRLVSLGTMAAGAAHELNNPLTVVATSSEFLADDLQQLRADLKASASYQVAEQRLNKMAATLRDVGAAAERMGRIVSDLRTFSRPAEGHREAVDLPECAERAVRMTLHEFRHRALLVTQFGDVPPVIADEVRLEQVIINLLVNAAQAIPPGSANGNEVRVVTRTDDRGRAVIEVCDTGAGIPNDIRDRIFDPFFTTKEVGAGTGLGLSICQGIINSLGGQIEIDSVVGKGTTVRVLLRPAPAQEAALNPGGSPTDEPLRGRILVVDDEEMLLRVIRRLLEDAGHEVICTSAAHEALALIQRGEQFDVILCDLTMPIMTGIEFYETLLDQRPSLAHRIVFVSGGAISAKAADFLESVSNLRIQKPFKGATLCEVVQRLLVAQGTGSQRRRSQGAAA